jgi:transposase
VKKFIRIGVDLAKNVFQLHALVDEGGLTLQRRLSRAKFRDFFSRLEPCRVGMEACGSAHYWARELMAMGHEVALIPPAYVKPYVKRGKTDAADAATICEAMSRPDMRFAPVKSAQQQAELMLHKTRELLVKQRTMAVNALRGHLSEFGVIAPKGIERIEDLVAMAQADQDLPEEAKQAALLLAGHSEQLDAKIDALAKTIAQSSAKNPVSRVLKEVPAIGPLIASAIAANLPDPGAFKSGRDFAAWLGLTPGQRSSGGKEKLGPITKKGNRYLRKMLVVGSSAVLRVSGRYKGALADWINAVKARKPTRLAQVALANKVARIAWAIASTGECFRAELYTRA